MEATERIQRERDYHNLRFADDSEREQRVGRFYSAIDYIFRFYRHRVLEESRGRTALEYGCGNGTFVFDLAREAAHVIGIDISDVAIAQAGLLAARRGIANTSFRVENAEAMQLPDRSVDVVAGSGIVHHLDIAKAMREVRRVLRPGGIAIFAEPLGHNPVLNWYRNRTPELRTPDEHPLLSRDLRYIACGFAATRVTYFGLLSPVLGVVARQTDPTSIATRAIWALDRWICALPGVRRYAWYCVLELRV